MKKPFSLTGFLSGSILIILISAMVLSGASGCHSNVKADPLNTGDTSGSLLDSFKKRTVPLKDVMLNVDYFNKNCSFKIVNHKKKDTTDIPFRGSRLRNADVLASLGLIEGNNIFKYIECEKIRLRTQFGYDSIKNVIKIYVHPVVVDKQNNVTGVLFFDSNGALYLYNEATKTGTLYSPPCTYPAGVSNQINKHDAIQTLPLDQLYAVDLNNPCPPCSL